MRVIKICLYVLIIQNISYLYAYDYSWPVEYEFYESSTEKINKAVTDFIIDNPGMQVYIFNKWVNEKYEIKENEFKINDELCTLNLEKREWRPFGLVLCGSIFLQDVGYSVGFYIPYVSGVKKNYIRFVSYSSKIKKIEERNIINYKNKGTQKAFNDVEPTKQEIPIKESFEKNFLAKLPLEWEYKKPAALDRFFSKLLSLFRKRKNFIDD